jgi:hypothetical protein
MTVGYEGDFGDRIYIPKDAIIRFCTLKQLPIPTFFIPAATETGPTLSDEEVYGALVSIGPTERHQLAALAAEVGQRLKKNVKSTMRSFQRALMRAKADGVVRIAKVGRPLKGCE